MVKSVAAVFRRGRPSLRFTIASVFAVLISISTAAPSLALSVAAPLSSTKITSSFGYRVHPVTSKYSFHNGVDFRAKLNQEVKSVMPGVVVKAGWRGNLGKAVEIYHPEKKLRTIYGHLNKIAVKKGERLTAGAVIGGAGTTGRSTGVHLHLIAKRENGTYVDSSKIIAKSTTIAAKTVYKAPSMKATMTNRITTDHKVEERDSSASSVSASIADSDGLFGSLVVATLQTWMTKLVSIAQI